jgi:uncharacterized protein YlaN (UPF0358 family)
MKTQRLTEQKALEHFEEQTKKILQRIYSIWKNMKVQMENLTGRSGVHPPGFWA